MKKILLAVIALMTLLPAKAQDKKLFNHVSMGLNLGTNGVGLDLAVPCTRFLNIRAGVDMLPPIKHSIHLDMVEVGQRQKDAIMDYPGAPEADKQELLNRIAILEQNGLNVEGKLNMLDGKVLVDFYPCKRFCITVGAFIGREDILTVRTKDAKIPDVTLANQYIDAYNEANPADPINNISIVKYLGLDLDDHVLTPDEEGAMHAAIHTRRVKPYVGLGFGRNIPKKRISFKCELGAKFWGSPKVTCNGTEITKEDVNGNGGDIMKLIGKVSVYPVLNFRIAGRLF